MKVFFNKEKKDKIKVLEEENCKLKDKNFNLEIEINVLENSVQELKVELSQAKAQISNLENNIKAIESKNNQTQVFNEWLYGKQQEGE